MGIANVQRPKQIDTDKAEGSRLAGAVWRGECARAEHLSRGETGVKNNHVRRRTQMNDASERMLTVVLRAESLMQNVI
jgi:hypothetical protein